ncbi:hypothetical protein [Clostridium intestinale]|nr:hypothetical protein [Clostridium intestinale]
MKERVLYDINQIYKNGDVGYALTSMSIETIGFQSLKVFLLKII